MAKVIKITECKNLKSVRSNITDVDMNISYSVDNKMIILETFGSNTRKETGKTSQVIHMDKNIAKELMSIIQRWV